MITLDRPAGLQLYPDTLRSSFNREPFGFEHSLSGLDIFKFEEIYALTEKYIGRSEDYYVACGASKPDTVFFSVPRSSHPPHEAMQLLDTGSYRILLKRPECYDPRFRDLINQLFSQVADSLGGFDGDRIVRLEAGLLITSPATTTPFHFDPEIGFFSQIEGEKIYHVYSPSILGEEELEDFYKLGRVAIAQIDLEGRDPAREHVFTLGPGKGLHQPQNAAHWVETRGSRSISYAFVFETEAGRARGRTRAFNHFLRCLKLNPARPGVNPAFDLIKSEAMRSVLPVRRRLADIVHRNRA
ncbi:MAG TPA: hypothetical protein VLZ74_14545 [Methylocella sp.]|nr:hypothetical protein [Methylocella sp.]